MVKVESGIIKDDNGVENIIVGLNADENASRGEYLAIIAKLVDELLTKKDMKLEDIIKILESQFK